jgi:hypothetical protein
LRKRGRSPSQDSQYRIAYSPQWRDQLSHAKGAPRYEVSATVALQRSPPTELVVPMIRSSRVTGG